MLQDKWLVVYADKLDARIVRTTCVNIPNHGISLIDTK